MDASEYLQPDFDPSKCKVAQLRNVLLQNDVSYPSAAKKSDLVKLFNDHIKPSASKQLRKLNSVVANDSGIEVVEKKKKKKSTNVDDVDTITVEKRKVKSTSVPPQSSALERTLSPTRKSPRKISRSKTEEVDSKDVAKKRDTTNAIKKIPDLQKDGSKTRESSPRRKVSSKSEERDQSPIRSERPSSTRERSPARRSRGSERKQQEKEKKVVKTAGKKTSATEVKTVSDSESDSDIHQVSEKEFHNSETSFSNENVFQSPDTSKSIPKKRSTEHHQKSPRKTTKTRKTAFSSSPAAEQRPKSPMKKSLEISKFEPSSPPGSVGNDTLDHDIFNFGQDNTDIKFENVRKSPVRISPLKHSEVDEFSTPTEGKPKRVSDVSSPLKREAKEEISEKSKFKITTESANTLGIHLGFNKAEPSEETAQEDSSEEHRELLDKSIDDEDDDALNDSELFNLQNDIDNAKAAILQEAEEAVQQINDIFNEEASQQAETSGKLENAGQKTSFSVRPILAFLKQLFLFLIIVGTVISGLWYREQRILIGYCGSEIDQPTFPDTNNEFLLKVDNLLQSVKPTCLKCPKNAICLPNMQLKCKQDYIVHEPWYKLYGVLPFEDYCVKDQEKENIIHEILSKSLELLRTRNANYKCGDGDDLEVGISDDELYDFFFHSKKSTITDEDFNKLWVRVLKDLENEPEITLQYQRDIDTGSSPDLLSSDENEEKETSFPTKVVFRSNSNAKLSIRCKFQKEVYEKVQSNKKTIQTLIFASCISVFIYFKIKSYQVQQSKINEISEIVINKLKKQTKASIVDPTGLTNRYLSAMQLRDELLSNLSNASKFKLWELILRKLDKKSNIRSSTKEIHGEIVKVLEWIGE